MHSNAQDDELCTAEESKTRFAAKLCALLLNDATDVMRCFLKVNLVTNQEPDLQNVGTSLIYNSKINF